MVSREACRTKHSTKTCPRAAWHPKYATHVQHKSHRKAFETKWATRGYTIIAYAMHGSHMMNHTFIYIYIWPCIGGRFRPCICTCMCIYWQYTRPGFISFGQIHGFQLLRTPHTYPPFKGDGVWGTKMGFIYGALCPLVVPSGSFQKDRVLHFHRRLVQQQRLFRMHEPEQTGALNLLLNDRRHCQALDGLLFMCTLGD